MSVHIELATAAIEEQQAAPRWVECCNWVDMRPRYRLYRVAEGAREPYVGCGLVAVSESEARPISPVGDTAAQPIGYCSATMRGSEDEAVAWLVTRHDERANGTAD